MINPGETFANNVKKVVYKLFEKHNVLQGEWHLGKVDTIIDSKHLKVFVDGSNVSQTVSCNPDVTFNIGDEVFVIFVNKDSKDKFVISKRAV